MQSEFKYYKAKGNDFLRELYENTDRGWIKIAKSIAQNTIQKMERELKKNPIALYLNEKTQVKMRYMGIRRMKETLTEVAGECKEEEVLDTL